MGAPLQVQADKASFRRASGGPCTRRLFKRRAVDSDRYPLANATKGPRILGINRTDIPPGGTGTDSFNTGRSPQKQLYAGGERTDPLRQQKANPQKWESKGPNQGAGAPTGGQLTAQLRKGALSSLFCCCTVINKHGARKTRYSSKTI